MEPISVYVVGEHRTVGDAIRTVLERDPALDLLEIESDSAVAIARIFELNPKVVLLELNGSASGGISVLVKCKPFLQATQFLVVSDDISVEQAMAVMGTGASGIVTTTAPLHLLCTAAKCVANGEIWLEPRYMAELKRRVFSPRGRWTKLRPRERDVIKGVVDALSNREIGEWLNIKEGTVKAYLKRIFRKLYVKSRTELASHALAQGMTTGAVRGRPRLKTQM